MYFKLFKIRLFSHPRRLATLTFVLATAAPAAIHVRVCPLSFARPRHGEDLIVLRVEVIVDSSLCGKCERVRKV